MLMSSSARPPRGHKRSGSRSRDRRATKQMYREFWRKVAKQDMLDSQLLSRLSDFNWNFDQIDVNEPKTRLRQVKRGTVADMYERDEPSVLETPHCEVNWYSQDRHQPMRYLMKCVANPASVEAMSNTLLRLARGDNAPVINIHVDFLSMETARSHQEELEASRLER